MTQQPYGIKELHEEAGCVRFLKAYNAAHGTSIQFRKLQVPRRPDCLCSGGLEIEMVGVYYNRDAARQRFELARGKTTDVNSSLMVEPDEMIFSQIDAAIGSKSGKSYWVNWRLWLVIHIDAPILEWQELEDGYLNSPRAAKMGSFDQIWVLMSDINGDHISRVRVTGGHRFEWARSAVVLVLRWIQSRGRDLTR
jgi:hypothetical protein